jgi:hypothetical protein
MRRLPALTLLALGLCRYALAGPPIPGPEFDARFAGSALTLLGCLFLLRKR